MTLQARRMRFEYGDDFDPAWNPRFPEFACAANSISLIMPYAEPYFVASVRAALPQLDNDLRDQTDAYLRQELQHYRQHRAFNRLVGTRYPRLPRVERWMSRAYGWLGRTRSLRFNVAFAAGSETIAYSLARWTEKHLGQLFTGADPQATSLYLWHLAEEIEHKSAAYDVFEAIDGSRLRYACASIVSLTFLFWLTWAATIVMLAGERRVFYPVTWFRLVRWSISLAFEILPTQLSSALPGHHPRSLVDPIYLPAWLAHFDPATGTLPLWEDAAGVTDTVPRDDADLTLTERRDLGRRARKAVPRRSHAAWAPPADRPDPVALLEEQNEDRLPWLVPVRRGRMAVSPFTFYRGAARIMANDLAASASSGLTSQICGDAHLANFGLYASPERQLVFDTNDFDETLAGPWEWDVKRMAVSFTIAAQHRGFETNTCAGVTSASVRAYRQAMLSFADMRTLDVWYQRLSAESVADLDQSAPRADRKLLDKLESKARSKDSLQALRKLTVVVDGEHQIRSDPPVLMRMDDLPTNSRPDDYQQIIYDALQTYKTSLSDDRRRLLERFHPVDTALKVVGVGSVGTRCFILLLEGRDRDDPLFLQVKEATHSVLEEHLGSSGYDNHGQRVVEGQRSMQAVSDIFLGWTAGREGRHFYVRQLRDWKGSVDLERINARQLSRYADACGWTLARGHARTGDPVAIAAYLGTGDTFDQAITEFSAAYADQNRADFKAFSSRIDAGELVVDRET